MPERPKKTIEEVVAQDGRYPLDAVQFVREGLNYAVSQVYGNNESQLGGRRHISGSQLCEGLRELALKRWGMLSRMVLKRWGIERTRDFGEIVFMLVESGWMQKEPSDNIEDFDEVFELADVFDGRIELPEEEG